MGQFNKVLLAIDKVHRGPWTADQAYVGFEPNSIMLSYKELN